MMIILLEKKAESEENGEELIHIEVTAPKERTRISEKKLISLT